MSFCKKAVIFACLVAALYISCWESDPTGPDNEDCFEIVAGPTVTDADGNVYTSVVIGNQIWTVENWRSTKYADGTKIPHVEDGAAWAERTMPGYCYYDNATNEDSIQKWGALYNWYVVSPTNPKQIAPEGWRVPSHTDWDTLHHYIVISRYNWEKTGELCNSGKAMAAQTDWKSSTATGAIGNDLSKNNASGFSALPGGYRIGGNFDRMNDYGYWWIATEVGAWDASGQFLSHGDEGRGWITSCKKCGFSLRLVRDR